MSGKWNRQICRSFSFIFFQTKFLICWITQICCWLNKMQKTRAIVDLLKQLLLGVFPPFIISLCSAAIAVLLRWCTSSWINIFNYLAATTTANTNRFVNSASVVYNFALRLASCCWSPRRRHMRVTYSSGTWPQWNTMTNQTSRDKDPETYDNLGYIKPRAL